jgi:hypothetical protein
VWEGKELNDIEAAVILAKRLGFLETKLRELAVLLNEPGESEPEQLIDSSIESVRQWLRLSEVPPLTLMQRITLKILGSVKIGRIRAPGWSDWLPAYAFHCERHGVVINYPQGYSEQLHCRLCLEEAET